MTAREELRRELERELGPCSDLDLWFAEELRAIPSTPEIPPTADPRPVRSSVPNSRNDEGLNFINPATSSSSRPSVGVGVGVGVGVTEVQADLPDANELLTRHANGQLEPVLVELVRPAQARAVSHRVADDLELIFGLLLAVGDTRPAIYAGGWAAKRLGLKPGPVAWALRSFTSAGTIRHVGSLPSLDGFREGPRLYVPGPGAKIGDQDAGNQP